MPISNDLFLTADANVVRIALTKYPVTDEAEIRMNIKDIDNSFQRFAFPRFWMSEAMAINDKGEFIIPYHYETDSSTYGLKVAHFKASITNNYFINLSEPEFFLIENENSERANFYFIQSIHCFNDNFFITDNYRTYMVGPNKELKEVLKAPLHKIFKIEGKLYGLDNDDLYISNDGTNWMESGTIDYQIKFLNFEQVDDSTIGYYNSQIFLIESVEQTIQATELNTEGLHGNTITSISKFNNKVYATTLSGVFFMNEDNFWQVKDGPIQ